MQRRLEEFRRNLLDTSLRNRLINFRTQTKAGKPLEKVVEIFGEDPVELLRILVTEGKAMSFVGRPDPRPAKKDEGQMEIDDFGDEASLARFRAEAEREIDTFLATGQEIVDTTDLKLNTHDTVSALQRKLTKIARDAKVATEEQGVNVLFLALGSLDWYESDASEELRRAPLILLPVSLERTNAGAFRLRWDGTDAGANLSIAAKLKAEFEIRLPELPDEADVTAYFRDVERAVESQGRWSVDRSAVALAFFSYAKFLMYRDLDSAGWPEEQKPATHETLAALLDGGFDESEPGISEDAFLDPLRLPGDVCEVYDADGSQTLAILEANTGRTMIVEGPPGTGKSQTITNLIAEAVGAGKKVLFVAEKAAALDVVYRRLREANLEDACLELHSNKANKRGFYGELKRTVGVAAPKAAKVAADLKRLEKDRAKLNDYAASVNALLEPYGISPRFAMGKLVALGPEPTPQGRHNFSAMAGWSKETFLERLDVVGRLQQQVALMGRPADHPYRGCTLDHLLPQDKDDLARHLAAAGEATEAFHCSANALAEALRVELPVRPADIERLREWAQFVARSPEVRGLAIRADWAIQEEEVRRAISAGHRLKEILGRIGPTLASDAMERDVSPFRELLRMRSLIGPAAEERTAGELAPLMNALDKVASEAFALMETAGAQARTIGVPVPTCLGEIEPLAALLKRLGSAPDVRGIAVSASEWKESGAALDEALDAVKRYREAHARYDAVLQEAAWRADVGNDLAALEAHGGSFFRFLNGTFRKAMARSRVHFVAPSRNPAERITGLRAIGDAREAEAVTARHRGRMSALFGERWQGVRSDGEKLAEAASWIQEAHLSGKVPSVALEALERGSEPSDLGHAGEALRKAYASTVGAIEGFRRSLTGLNIRSLEDATSDANESTLRYVLATLRPALPELKAVVPGARAGFAGALEVLDALAEAQEARRAVRRGSATGKSLGDRWRDEATDWDEAQAALDWVVGLHRAVAEGRLPAGLIGFFADAYPREGLDEAVRVAQRGRVAAQESVRKVLELARLGRDPAAFTEMPIAEQRQQIAQWAQRLDDLPALIRFNSIAAEANRLGLGESVALADTWEAAGERLAEAFARSWYTGVVRQAVQERPILAQFDRASHEATVQEFRALDGMSLRYNRAKVALAHWRSVPRGTAGGAMGWLSLQFNLRQNHKPIRTAMDKAGKAVQAIKPVFLMSPLSVAMYLPADGPRFDVVIFDEASQVKPEDAFGGIVRARQTIVVGDSKQMPPTSFFDKLTSEGTEEEEDDVADDLGGAMKELESVLAMMSAKLPTKSPRRRDLRWHYRSRHDALIATSNRLFYDDRLVVFPSPWRGGANAGLILRHDPTTVYGRGGSRKNVEEARAVAEAARRHVLEHPKLTLGIAAFSKAQQEAIQDELDRLRKSEPALTAFDETHLFEPLFVKNLENVQGDERDVILISVGYGRDEHGYIPASFGPLNRDGGERRLNVLITRARVRCEVFTNLKAADIRLSQVPARGVLALRTFLAFADTGSLDVPAATGLEPQSPFEEAVLERLRANGYDVEPQVGSCGFYIDLAVRHPEHPQRFVLGIECDGAMYHSARTARDRDKLRQQVLESRGWRMHRIWSTDWFQNPVREFERLTQAIAAAMTRADADIAEESARPSAFVELERDEEVAVETGVTPYALCDLRVNLGGLELHEVARSQVADWVVRVVEIESPVHLDEVVRRIREAAGLARAGNRIREAVEGGYSLAERQGRLLVRGEFLHLPGQEKVPVRSRADLPASAKRLETVAPEEAMAALTDVVRASYGIEPDEAAALAAKKLGFDRITAGMAERLRGLISAGVEAGAFTNDGGLIR